jgi:fructose-specific phosphotransferase system IIA component
MNLSEVITPAIIDLAVDAEDKASVFAHLATLLEQDRRLNDREAYLQNVQEREALATTGIGFGIAIPHGKTDAVNTVSVAIAKLAKPIDWQAMDDAPVDTVFQLAVPAASQGDAHLNLLAALSRKLIHADFRAQIKAATTPEQVIELIGSTINQTLEV